MIKKISFFLLLTTMSVCANAQTFNIRFEHIANGKIIHRDSIYKTPSGEPYSIRKLKYYITPGNEGNKVYPSLIDAFGNDSLKFILPIKNEKSFSLMLGVDSMYHFSGAQDGSLDPLNDMFWTWNTGYVAFKLEGRSDSSAAPLQKIEYHLGGFQETNKVAQMLHFSVPENIILKKNETYDVLIDVILDEFWEENLIQKNPAIVVQGKEAVVRAASTSKIFHLKKIEKRSGA